QAIRIAVNGELDQIDEGLPEAWSLLRISGRFAGISFHSLEDRMVKQAFAALAHPCRCPPGMPVCGCGAAEWALASRKSIVAGEDEVAANPRSRSARLRAVRRL
ncbi:MAG TPA: 16S rRNA (cytosine(1402)-N(4))-methyltransferase, partial [Vulgatibacter sp.]